MGRFCLFMSIGVYFSIFSFIKTSTFSRPTREDTTLDHKDGSFQLSSLKTGHGRNLSAEDYCNQSGCGTNGICVITSSLVCSCLKGFNPNSPQNWNLGQYQEGCARAQAMSCQNKTGFVKYSGVRLPDVMNSWENQSLSLGECREGCLRNCSCMAYAIRPNVGGGGTSCTIWFGDLINIREALDGGHDLYIRMPATESKRSSSKMKIAVTVVSVAVVVSLTLLAVYCIHRKRTKSKVKMGGSSAIMGHNNEGQKEDLELPIFSLSTIVTATDKFALSQKLGEGGFGLVYKGRLEDGQEIAVKRLSRSSKQGPNEFKNEALLIAKLQHRNLVKLLGYCIAEEEKLLIYEYMPNKSLDFHIFDQTQSRLLDWSQRLTIIYGIARGLLYLHEDSRLRIIHRDLKASNILLDKEMNPKISDFGLARIFGGDQTEGITRKVVGTYGYMAPEYAIDGQFSMKSDVFSFGILLLEIVSGKRSSGFCDPEDHLSLIAHAWKLWKGDRSLELIDGSFTDSCTLSEVEVLRCIHVSLLCVQQLPEDRPTMSSVILMLGDECPLPEPRKPSFFGGKHSFEADSSSKTKSSSIYDSIITIPEAR